ncbi:glutathione S-transferase U10-like [Solanum verrucosum]|nr:glutathione S-transferase U10-like [Solanum verrucosum]
MSTQKNYQRGKMGEENKVTLHGMWLSPYVKRVELALKVKGIPFEYIEEDLSNKSPLILKYNPIHKKVPILVHNGKPVNESFVIVEYIDETWKNGPQLLPEDPYERSKVRFWAAYIQQVMECMLNIFTAEDQKKACKEFHQKFSVLEDGLKTFFPGGNPKIENRNIGLVDIWIIVAFGMCKAQEEAFGVNFLDPEKAPLILSWVNSLLELPLLKETVPNHDKAVSFLRVLKERSTNGQAH